MSVRVPFLYRGGRRPLVVSVSYRSRRCQTTFRLAHSKKSGLLGVLIICVLAYPQEVCPSAVACSCACGPVGYEEELKLDVSFCSKALWREKVRRGTAS